jgi:hypothetical protein
MVLRSFVSKIIYVLGAMKDCLRIVLSDASRGGCKPIVPTAICMVPVCRCDSQYDYLVGIINNNSLRAMQMCSSRSSKERLVSRLKHVLLSTEFVK